MGKHTKHVRKAEKAVDAFREKRGRGRPQKIPRSWVIGHAENYRKMLTDVWSKLSSPLFAAETAEQIVAAFEQQGQPYAGEFVPRLATDILILIRGPGFPTKPKAQISFLADSLAGRPSVEFRTSRDICGKDRTKKRAESPYRILQKEFYVECSCGYKGPARNDACKKCGAQISYLPQMLLGTQFR